MVTEQLILYLIDVVLILFGIYLWKFVPGNGELHQRVLRMTKEVAKLRAELEVSSTELWEFMDGTLQPLSMRLSTRLKRQDKKDQKDLSSEETTKRGGILSPNQILQMKKDGVIQ